jgi:hypothetical protein
MSRHFESMPLGAALAAMLTLLVPAGAHAQDLLIRNATVHTAGARGTLEHGDVLVQAGRIAAVGAHLAAPPGTSVIEAHGRPLTPGLFAGVAGLGLEEVSGEATTVDSAQSFGSETMAGQMRPEFDVTLAYNPDSITLPVARAEGMTFAALPAESTEGGSLLAGQGGVVRLDGDADGALPGRQLYVSLGGGAEVLGGHSRAAQLMLLEQAVREARGLTPYASPYAQLTPAGREALAKFLAGGRVLFAVDRAADIRQVLAFARRHGLHPAILGGTEAWRVAAALAAAHVPVLLDPLQNLPSSYDQLGARLDNAALLQRAGVPVAFVQFDDAVHLAGKQRQAAGNAVAHGLPWDAALAALTRVPAEVFGVGDRVGRIEPGLLADLVLWDGDPLEVTTLPDAVWMRGVAMPLRSRQTQLRDRYLPAPGALPRAYSPGNPQ